MNFKTYWMIELKDKSLCIGAGERGLVHAAFTSCTAMKFINKEDAEKFLNLNLQTVKDNYSIEEHGFEV